MKTNTIGRSITRLSTAVMVAGTLVLAGCGGGDDGPTPEEIARMEAEKQAAMELAEASAAIEAANEAAVMLDSMSDAAAVAAVEALITTAETEIGDLPAADQADATAMLAAAQAIVTQANERLRIAAEAAAAAIQAEADAAKAAEEAAAAATAAAEAKAAEEAQALADAMAAAARNEAAQALSAALSAAVTLNSMSDSAAVMAVEALIATATMEIEDLPADEQAAHKATLAVAQAVVDAQNMRLTTAAQEAEKERQAAAEKAAAEAEKAAAEMAALAAKLYAGISAPEGGTTSGNFTADDRAAAYNAANTTGAAVDGVPDGSAAATLIMVSIGDGTTAPTAAIPLSEDKDTVVAALHGWAGKRYHRTTPAADGTYEAMVYSNVEAPKMGKKFGSATALPTDAAELAAFAYQYQLDAADRDGTANKALTYVAADHAARVSLTGVTRTSGTETFKLPEQNPDGEQFINVPGTLHGVSGTYSCAPTTAALGCTALVAAKGFTLGGGTWLFIPSNAEARVMDSTDTNYASYGWWLHKSATDVHTASAFHDFKGTAGAVDIANLLGGSATYTGGAAGKYALQSPVSTGGTNDAGHFTARATLEADFEDDEITGTINNFVGGDGESRDWSVELKAAAIAGDGGIARTGANQTDNDTVWTIGGTAASASGEWSGNLREEGTDGVPKAATGTFYSEYGTAGRMVGAFGANKQ